jgi:hypothetical protein
MGAWLWDRWRHRGGPDAVALREIGRGEKPFDHRERLEAKARLGDARGRVLLWLGGGAHRGGS